MDRGFLTDRKDYGTITVSRLGGRSVPQCRECPGALRQLSRVQFTIHLS